MSKKSTKDIAKKHKVNQNKTGMFGQGIHLEPDTPGNVMVSTLVDQKFVMSTHNGRDTDGFLVQAEVFKHIFKPNTKISLKDCKFTVLIEVPADYLSPETRVVFDKAGGAFFVASEEAVKNQFSKVVPELVIKGDGDDT